MCRRGRFRASVAPLTGSVDRNLEGDVQRLAVPRVAPLTGSVDRNLHFSRPDKGPLVAPLTGSVDRNRKEAETVFNAAESLPSRGAWIEIGSNLIPLWKADGRSPHGERG